MGTNEFAEELREIKKAVESSIYELDKRLINLTETVTSLYELQQKQTALLEKIAASNHEKCVFPKGVGLSNEEMEHFFEFPKGVGLSNK